MKHIVTLIALLLPLAAPAAEKISIAAAANLTFALEALHADFKKVEPDVEVQLVTGASGSLVSQIKNGAPFDVFLSADMTFPRQLATSGDADANTLTNFATGRLVFWTTRPNVELGSIAAAVRSPAVRRLAIANVETAPFGRAAKEALAKLGAWDDVQAKLVFGENISQAAQYVETGNADAGFVALSIVLAPAVQGKGRWLEVPAELFAPLDQGAILTRRGSMNAAARRYLIFLRGPAARAVFERFGYRVPDSH